MSSVLTRYPGRIMAMSLGLRLFTLTSLTPLLAQAPPSGDTFVSKDYPKANYGSLFALGQAGHDDLHPVQPGHRARGH
jgi:hypothetical protein